MWACARDTRIVSALGRSRQRLAGVLNSAFAEGLLSEQTHSYRLGLLFAPRLIDPQRLVGDLTLRRGRSRPGVVARRAWDALAASVRTAAGFGGSPVMPLLLVLDQAESVWGAYIRSGVVLRGDRVLVDEAAEPVASADRSR